MNTSDGGVDYQCQISSCDVDERIDVDTSTEGAIELLKEVWEDDELSESGSVVQMAIVGHNVGYNDKMYGINRKTNILPAYKKYMTKKKRKTGVFFYGENILCGADKDPHKAGNYSNLCGGFLPNQGQIESFQKSQEY